MPINSVTRGILENLSASELVPVYNMIPGVRPVARFSDGPTARKRVEMALEREGWLLVRLASGAVIAAPETRAQQAQDKYIVLLIDRNPKHPHSASHERFALLRTGLRVRDWRAMCQRIQPGITREKLQKDMYWDRDRGYVTLVDEPPVIEEKK